MDKAQLFAVGIALAWLAGIRVYLTVFGVGLAAALGWVELPDGLKVCASPWVLGVSGLLALVEFATDKMPGVDSVWDLLHTVLRIPAGAFLASAALSPDGQWSWGGAVAGGFVALASHGLKAGTRAMINTSPEPASNWLASSSEDAVALAALALVFTHPWLTLFSLVSLGVLVFLLVLWVFRRIFRQRRPQPV